VSDKYDILTSEHRQVCVVEKATKRIVFDGVFDALGELLEQLQDGIEDAKEGRLTDHEEVKREVMKPDSPKQTENAVGYLGPTGVGFATGVNWESTEPPRVRLAWDQFGDKDLFFVREYRYWIARIGRHSPGKWEAWSTNDQFRFIGSLPDCKAACERHAAEQEKSQKEASRGT
jgi:hypothetical protein